jgi:hypothetical protein
MFGLSYEDWLAHHRNATLLEAEHYIHPLFNQQPEGYLLDFFFEVFHLSYLKPNHCTCIIQHFPFLIEFGLAASPCPCVAMSFRSARCPLPAAS